MKAGQFTINSARRGGFKTETTATKGVTRYLIPTEVKKSELRMKYEEQCEKVLDTYAGDTLRRSHVYGGKKTPFSVTQGKWLKAKRKDTGLSQEDFASIARLDRTYPSLLERGLRGPTLLVWITMCHALGDDPVNCLKSLLKDLRESNVAISTRNRTAAKRDIREHVRHVG